MGPIYLHGLTLIPARISNYMPSEVWGVLLIRGNKMAHGQQWLDPLYMK